MFTPTFSELIRLLAGMSLLIAQRRIARKLSPDKAAIVTALPSTTPLYLLLVASTPVATIGALCSAVAGYVMVCLWAEIAVCTRRPLIATVAVIPAFLLANSTLYGLIESEISWVTGLVLIMIMGLGWSACRNLEIVEQPANSPASQKSNNYLDLAPAFCFATLTILRWYFPAVDFVCGLPVVTITSLIVEYVSCGPRRTIKIARGFPKGQLVTVTFLVIFMVMTPNGHVAVSGIAAYAGATVVLALLWRSGDSAPRMVTLAPNATVREWRPILLGRGRPSLNRQDRL